MICLDFDRLRGSLDRVFEVRGKSILPVSPQRRLVRNQFKIETMAQR